MTKQEAIHAMSEGKKVTHYFFTPEEWVTCKGNKMLTEEGYEHDPYEFWSWRKGADWNEGWELYHVEQKTK